MKLVSPNEMMSAAKDMMLDGREPESHEDWALLMNFLAANVAAEAALPACHVISQIYSMPLSRSEVTAIVEFQLARR